MAGGVTCPSCGIPAPDGRCPRCLAQYDGHTWRWQKLVEQAKPKRENYFTCPECSTAAGEPVIYHKSALQDEDEIFGEEGQKLCPKGHAIPKAAA